MDHRTVTVSILLDPDAQKTLADPAFRSRWTELASADPKFTLLQEPPFVLVWYEQHRSVFEPVLCIGRRADEVVGIMPLARSRKSGLLVHAGDFHAEYHGWIAEPELDEVFAESCLIALAKRFPMRTWQWNCMPPGSPTGWLTGSRLRGAGIHVISQAMTQPLVDFTNPERIEQIAKIKSIKNQFSRYRKRGEFRLERVCDPERTRELFQILKVYSDERHANIHGNRPFADNPLKEPFFLARQTCPEANHFTILWSGDKPVSFHFGACDRETVVLGLTAYDPSESQNSPGKLHLIELSRAAAAEGFRYLDLTPGKEAYKHEFANTQRPVLRPKFYFSRVTWLMDTLDAAARNAVKQTLSRGNLDPKKVRTWIDKTKRRVFTWRAKSGRRPAP